MPQSATPETTPAKEKSLVARCSWAVMVTAAALGVLLMDPILGFRIPYATFYIAVAISAVLGGWGAGASVGLARRLGSSILFCRPGITY